MTMSARGDVPGEDRLGGLGRSRRRRADRGWGGRDRRRRHDRGRRGRRRSRTRRASRGLRDHSRLRQRALAHRVRRLRRLRRRTAVRPPGSGCTCSARRRSTTTTWSRLRRWGRTSACARGSRRSATAASPAPRRSRAAATGLRAIVYLEVFGRATRRRSIASTSRASASSTCSRTGSGSASRRMRRTPARSRSTAPAPSSACRRRRTLPRAPPSASGSSTARATGARSRTFLVPPSGETGIRLLAAEGLLGPSLMAAHCVHADAEEIALLAANGVGVAHCPRSNGYLGCGVAPVEELRAAGVDVSVATDSPASTPSLDLFEEIRTAIVAARARAGRPDALICCRRARARDARRRARARHGRSDRLARARKAGRPDRSLARELSVRSRGRSCYGSRPGRLPRPRHSYSGGRRTALLERNVPMARFDKSSTKRPKPNAAVAATRSGKRSTAPSIEDTMFFPRLRRHAKWMFVFLAVALGGGFVLFGVGAGGTGVGDILRGGGSSGVPSISSATKKTEKNPQDIQAWKDLSTALQTDGQTQEGDRRAEARRRAGAEGHRRTSRARGAQSRAGDGEAARGPAGAAPDCVRRRGPELPGLARLCHRAVAPRRPDQRRGQRAGLHERSRSWPVRRRRRLRTP